MNNKLAVVFVVFVGAVGGVGAVGVSAVRGRFPHAVVDATRFHGFDVADFPLGNPAYRF